MSNRRQPGNETTLDSIAATIGDQRIAGGCEDCDAYQTMHKQAEGLFTVTVHHDDTCPWLNARQGTPPSPPRRSSDEH